MWWTALITGKMQMPTDRPHYHLLAAKSSRIQYGVDHTTYMSTLVRDSGRAPGLMELYREHGAAGPSDLFLRRIVRHVLPGPRPLQVTSCAGNGAY